MKHVHATDLYDYFSPVPARQLGPEEREKIALHLESCRECADLGKGIVEDYDFINSLEATPETPEDRVALQRSIELFRSSIA